MKKSIHDTKYHTFIRMLRSLREERGITQEQLATSLKVNQAIISKIESCERRIDVIELKYICDAIGIDFKEFIYSMGELL